MIAHIVSSRVRVAFLVALCLFGAIVWGTPETRTRGSLWPAFPAPLSRFEVEAGTSRTVYEPVLDREEFEVVGPPETLADERRRREEADRKAVGEVTTDGLVGHKVPSVWRRQRLSALLVGVLSALRSGAVELLPDPVPQDRESSGVDHPEIVVRVQAGQLFELRVGNKAPTGLAHYFWCPQSRAYGVLGLDIVRKLKRLAAREVVGG